MKTKSTKINVHVTSDIDIQRFVEKKTIDDVMETLEAKAILLVSINEALRKSGCVKSDEILTYEQALEHAKEMKTK